jgi:hypothetical protein
LSFFVDIFYPPNFGDFEENGVFQQPRDISPTYDVEQMTSGKNDAPPLVILLLSFGADIALETVQSSLVQLD